MIDPELKPFIHVARQLWRDPSPLPEWVLPTLIRFAQVIAGPSVKLTPQDRRDDDKLIKHLRAVENELWIYEHLGERGFLEDDEADAFDHLGQGVSGAIEFIEELRNVGPHDARIDTRRDLCATVCAGVWRACVGKVQPHSHHLWKACDGYWRACGHHPVACVDTWQDFLLRVSHP